MVWAQARRGKSEERTPKGGAKRKQPSAASRAPFHSISAHGLPSLPFSCVGRGAGGAAPGKKRKGQEEDGETQRKKKAKGKTKPEPGPKRKKKRGKVDPNATLAKG